MIDEKPDPDSIFCAAIEIEDDNQRRAFLDQACLSDADVLREVERLLRAHFGAGSFLHDHPDLSPTLAQTSIAEEVGSSIGPYKLREQIGEGGFGVVYVAEQEQPVARIVALKIIKAGMDTKVVIARFEAERQALAMMDHPNVAKVFDAGTSESGRPYFVMELVRGVTITEFCDEQKFSIRERLELFVDICRAVQHAHQKGIIHRDLKPANIMVTMRDDKPLPKVIDFGISKALSRKLTDKTIYTSYGQMIGTPHYMSPEQAQMNEIDVDTRSDVYSLGVLLYELLTGTTPFDNETIRNANFDGLRRIIRENEPPRPSARVSTLNAEMLSTACDHRRIDRHTLENALRGELDWIVMKAIEKDRSRRYETASAFATDIIKYLNHQPIQARPPSTWYHLWKLFQRQKLAVISITGITLTLLIALIGQIFSLTIINERTSEALAQREGKQEAQREAFEALQKKADALEREAAMSHYRRMALAQVAWQEGRVGQADGLLDEIPPDQRNWIWNYLKRLCHSEQSMFQIPQPLSRFTSFSADGQRLAFLAEDGNENPSREMSVWDAATGQKLYSRNDPEIITTMALDQAGDWVAIGTIDGHVRIVDVKNGTRQGQFSLGKTSVEGLAFGGQGQRMAVATSEDISVWNLAQHKLAMRVPFAKAQSLSFTRSGKQLVAASGEESTVIIWDIQRQEFIGKWSKLQQEPCAIAPRGNLLAVVPEKSRVIQIMDVETGKILHQLPKSRGTVDCLDFSSDGCLLAFGGSDRIVRIWDVHRGAQIRELRGHQHAIIGIAFSNDGNALRSIDARGRVKLWDPNRDQADLLKMF